MPRLILVLIIGLTCLNAASQVRNKILWGESKIVSSSNKDKNEALTPRDNIILVLKVLMDLTSRVLIFFTFMIVGSLSNRNLDYH